MDMKATGRHVLEGWIAPILLAEFSVSHRSLSGPEAMSCE